MSSQPSESPSDGGDETQGKRSEPVSHVESPPEPKLKEPGPTEPKLKEPGRIEPVPPTEATTPRPTPSDPTTAGLPQSNVGAKVDTVDEEEPITAKLANTIDESPVRVGSPFATDPFETQATPIEQIYDVGPLRYTAMGAVAAAGVVLFFAFVGFWWFPAGGAMIAALGCMLSIFGLYSTFRYTSAGLLTVHLALFVMSYGRSLG